MDKIPVLVLDDEEAITRLTDAVLTMHGFDVTESNDPLKALEMVKVRKFRLIMVDILMPGMTGIEFIRAARQTDMNCETKYAVLSAKRMNEEERREIFDLGAELMTKPFVPQRLVEKVQGLLA
ncbi:MAG: response regulator [Candidatus Lindowbacteria bacterium]|nr:response regulator [Candidatus Lindowbacteria bacterium]